jgi:hypothetical protein
MGSRSNKKKISVKQSCSHRDLSDKRFTESHEGEDLIIPVMIDEERATLLELLRILDTIDKRAKGIRT